MRREIVRIQNWPFKKDEKAKVMWIVDPFKENNKWMVNTYFKGDNPKRRITLDWANIHFLSVDKWYTNGDFNKGEVIGKKDIIDIDLSGVKAEYKEKDWENWGAGFKDKTKSKTFNFYKNNVWYTVPIIEIIRAILAPNRFLLNRIVEMDTLENYFLYEIEQNVLSIHFTYEYSKELLSTEKISHLAWLITNPKIFKMFNAIGQNMWQLGELKFDFLFENFNIKARVEKKENYIKVLEIVALKKKRINVEEIKVYHPSLDETEASDETQKRRYIGKNNDGEIDLTSNTDGAAKAFDEINTDLITHEYERIPKINKIKSGRKIRREKEDETTKTYIIDSGKSRTTADEGGQALIKGLEFTNIANVEEKGELEEFIEVLRLLDKRYDVKGVDIIIGNLPEGRIFSKLSNGITNRKYAIGKITMMDGRECSLIEVEREDRSLSMLVLKGNKLVKWKMIYSILLLGLVEESGKWSNCGIEKIETYNIDVVRKKHIERNIFEKEKIIHGNLL